MSKKTNTQLIVGVGNSGTTVLDRLAAEHPGFRSLLVVNNDAESLASSLVSDRLNVPEGDLGDGFRAIDPEFCKRIEGVSVVLLCAGLGGATASFLLPALATLAKASGITVLASVGMPFAFEGRQKRDLAASALKKLQSVCDAVSVIDNDLFSGGVPSTAPVGEAFKMADVSLLATLTSLLGMLSTSGPVRITRNDIVSVLGGNVRSNRFGFGSAAGSNRLHEALESALKSPLFSVHGKSNALRDATKALVFLSGPSDVSFAEVQLAVAEIERVTGEGCQVKVGVAAEAPLGTPLKIFIMMTSASASSPISDVPVLELQNPSEPVAVIPSIKQEQPAVKPKVVKPTAKGPVKPTQGVLELDAIFKGRFDKSEPTIVEGEDLDVPTFLRKGIKLSSQKK
jgi:cell division protein FtsZ